VKLPRNLVRAGFTAVIALRATPDEASGATQAGMLHIG